MSTQFVYHFVSIYFVLFFLFVSQSCYFIVLLLKQGTFLILFSYFMIKTTLLLCVRAIFFCNNFHLKSLCILDFQNFHQFIEQHLSYRIPYLYPYGTDIYVSPSLLYAYFIYTVNSLSTVYLCRPSTMLYILEVNAILKSTSFYIYARLFLVLLVFN